MSSSPYPRAATTEKSVSSTLQSPEPTHGLSRSVRLLLLAHPAQQPSPLQAQKPPGGREGHLDNWGWWLGSLRAPCRDGQLDGEAKHLSLQLCRVNLASLHDAPGAPLTAGSAAPIGVGRGELVRILQAEPWPGFMLFLLLH